MPRALIQSIVGFSSLRGISRRTVMARVDVLRRQAEASIRLREVHHRERSHSPMSNLGMIASLGTLGLLLVIVADLHVLGLI
jgi:hypothetical protein